MKFLRLVSINDLYLLIVIALVSIVSALPLPRAKSLIASYIGLAAFYISRTKRRRVEENLRQVFGASLSRLQVRAIGVASFQEFWRDIFALRLSKLERAALKEIEVVGIEYLTAALHKGRGVILIESSFLGRRNLAKQVLHQRGISIYQVHNMQHLAGFQINRPTFVQLRLVKPLLESWEKSFIQEIIYLPDSDSLLYAKQLLGVLKKTGVICISGDGKTGYKHIPFQFLGRSDRFPTGMMNLGKLSGASLLPIFCVTEGIGVKLVIEPPIESELDGESALQDSMIRYVHLLESYIKKYPSAYRHWHFQEPATR